ncbi:hypothetical protein BJV74DRAFT_41582 [Russula compacta]|nr:hypothetical protein BJV74DRAFT_41582 [Russula compacta]
METMVMTIPSPAHSHQMSELDIDLAALLDSLSLQQSIRTNEPASTPTASDIQMNDAGNYQSGTTASSSSSDAPHSPPAPCALLEALTRSYDPDAADSLQTTCGEYLELISIHREVFAARPSAHVGCPAAYSALARALELRAWRADRDADAEAVAAFRHEAWTVSVWLTCGGPWWRGGEKIAD